MDPIEDFTRTIDTSKWMLFPPGTKLTMDTTAEYSCPNSTHQMLRNVAETFTCQPNVNPEIPVIMSWADLASKQEHWSSSLPSCGEYNFGDLPTH